MRKNNTLKQRSKRKKILFYLRKYSPIYVFLLLGMALIWISYILGLYLLISLIFFAFCLPPLRYIWRKLEKRMDEDEDKKE